MKAWLKGGLIGLSIGIIPLILTILSVIPCTFFAASDIGYSTCNLIELIAGEPFDGSALDLGIPGFIIYPIILFLIGSIIGLIINRPSKETNLENNNNKIKLFYKILITLIVLLLIILLIIFIYDISYTSKITGKNYRECNSSLVCKDFPCPVEKEFHRTCSDSGFCQCKKVPFAM